jgi:hypothetical protein
MCKNRPFAICINLILHVYVHRSLLDQLPPISCLMNKLFRCCSLCEVGHDLLPGNVALDLLGLFSDRHSS